MQMQAGERHGRLVSVRRISASPNGQSSIWLFCCDCGEEKETLVSSVRAGRTTSCGCVQRERSGSRPKHGMSGTAEYRAWSCMKSRCYNPNLNRYSIYGGRGINVCDRWLNSFDNFLADVGHRPSKDYSLDRIDVNGNYEPSNVRWADRKTQARNKRSNRVVDIAGERMSLAEACERAGVNYKKVQDRLKDGWSIERALS